MNIDRGWRLTALGLLACGFCLAFTGTVLLLTNFGLPGRMVICGITIVWVGTTVATLGKSGVLRRLGNWNGRR